MSLALEAAASTGSGPVRRRASEGMATRALPAKTASWEAPPEHLMTDPKRYWAPRSAPSNLTMILAIDRGPGGPERRAIPLESEYRLEMAEKVAQLFAAAGSDAANVLEMSIERMPEMWTIRDDEPEHDWPVAVMRSDAMERLLAHIDWAQEASGMLPCLSPPEEIREELEEQTLRQLVEYL